MNSIVEDAEYKGMYRVHWFDGEISDMVNKTRAKYAIRRFEETDARRKREGAAKAPREPVQEFK